LMLMLRSNPGLRIKWALKGLGRDNKKREHYFFE
jgi:hypothetical protein